MHFLQHDLMNNTAMEAHAITCAERSNGLQASGCIHPALQYLNPACGAARDMFVDLL